MAELVDALRSGRSGRKAVEVRVLFWAPRNIFAKRNSYNIYQVKSRFWEKKPRCF